jgi:hypothetical protein
MPTKIPSTTVKFVFVTEKFYCENHKQLGRAQFELLRSKLSKGIYWLQPSGRGGKLVWNLPLLESYLVHGADSIEHQALVDSYLKTLPVAA